MIGWSHHPTRLGVDANAWKKAQRGGVRCSSSPLFASLCAGGCSVGAAQDWAEWQMTEALRAPSFVPHTHAQTSAARITTTQLLRAAQRALSGSATEPGPKAINVGCALETVWSYLVASNAFSQTRLLWHGRRSKGGGGEMKGQHRRDSGSGLSCFSAWD